MLQAEKTLAASQAQGWREPQVQVQVTSTAWRMRAGKASEAKWARQQPLALSPPLSEPQTQLPSVMRWGLPRLQQVERAELGWQLPSSR